MLIKQAKKYSSFFVSLTCKNASYCYSSILKTWCLFMHSSSPSPKSYIYARVSSAKQKADLSGKSNYSSINTLNTNSSQTLVAGSTSRGPDCVPYWNSHAEDWSKK